MRLSLPAFQIIGLPILLASFVLSVPVADAPEACRLLSPGCHHSYNQLVLHSIPRQNSWSNVDAPMHGLPCQSVSLSGPSLVSLFQIPTLLSRQISRTVANLGRDLKGVWSCSTQPQGWMGFPLPAGRPASEDRLLHLFPDILWS
ncbi:unnamed protein product [Cyclocybe aegerita]|uniref:Uncharacterized protein n=1 Tax=Cyclocybe aegerita TaxID=1973307 RepID=A0A8S0WPX0_CYCAE|nr:unnamed protein product [Cyclocybe aegerita]